MTDEELRSTIEQVKAQTKAVPDNAGKSDDEIDEIILDGFFKAYTEGKMTKEDLGAIADSMGYEFTEEFENDPNAIDNFDAGDADEALEPADEGEGEEGSEPAPETDKEILDDAKALKPGESAEEFKEKIDDIKSGEAPAEDEADEGDEEDDETEERKKASELWKINLNKD